MEGLYYVRAARIAMGMDPGPELESLSGQNVGGHRHRGPPSAVRGPRHRGLADARRSAPRTTTPAAASPVVRCPPAGTPSRGGSRRWSPAPGASVRRCCSARCSPAWAASATTPRASRTATATASRTAWTRASSDGGGDGGGGTAAAAGRRRRTAGAVGIRRRLVRRRRRLRWRRRRLRRRWRLRRVRLLNRSKPALQPRRHPGLLEVEPFQHGAHRFVLDLPSSRSAINAARCADSTSRIQRREHFGAHGVRVRIGHLVGVLRVPRDRGTDLGQHARVASLPADSPGTRPAPRRRRRAPRRSAFSSSSRSEAWSSVTADRQPADQQRQRPALDQQACRR